MIYEVEEYLNMSVWEKHNYLKKTYGCNTR
jgi:hypothetical protein